MQPCALPSTLSLLCESNPSLADRPFHKHMPISYLCDPGGSTLATQRPTLPLPRRPKPRQAATEHPDLFRHAPEPAPALARATLPLLLYRSSALPLIPPLPSAPAAPLPFPTTPGGLPCPFILLVPPRSPTCLLARSLRECEPLLLRFGGQAHLGGEPELWSELMMIHVRSNCHHLRP